MRITFWNPFRELAEFERGIDRMFRRTRQRSSYGYPPIDLIDAGDLFVLSAFLPGLSSEQIRLSVSGTTVTLQGRREIPVVESAKPLLRERVYGQFNKSVDLPHPVVEEEINAQYTDGVLRVTLPKRQSLQPKTISVN